MNRKILINNLNYDQDINLEKVIWVMNVHTKTYF